MIQKTETKIKGKWVSRNGKLVEDETCNRIENLISNYLVKVRADYSGWSVLYVDPNDYRFWVLSYPQSNRSGGGPPCLNYVNQEEIPQFMDKSPL